jgi:hypothetical protein
MLSTATIRDTISSLVQRPEGLAVGMLDEFGSQKLETSDDPKRNGALNVHAHSIAREVREIIKPDSVLNEAQTSFVKDMIDIAAVGRYEGESIEFATMQIATFINSCQNK